MAYITLLSSALSFFLIAISADVQDIMVHKFHIDIDLYPPYYNFSVGCYIVFKNLRTTQEISMYTDEIKYFPTVLVFKKDTDVDLYFETINVNTTTNIVTDRFKEEIEPGFYVMNYTGDKLFATAFKQVYTDRIHEKEVVWLSFSHFQPIWIQRIIPCWVKPKEDISWLDMPTFNLSILHFAHHTVLTNMAIREERLDEKARRPDMKRTYFDTTPRMSPYQLSIVVTNFTHIIIDEDDVVSMWCRNRSASSLQFALAITKNITTYLHHSRWFLRWRFSTGVKLIVIPKIQNYSTKSLSELNDSLVHPGIIIANEDDITYNEENDTVGRKYNVIRLLGYEVMREYYEWIVNPYWEPSTWLSKGFATFIATHTFNQALPNLRMIDLFVVQIQHECLDFDVDNSMLPFPDQNGTIPVEIIDNMKASVIWRMLQHASNAEAFRNAINTFTYESIIQNKPDHLEYFWETLKDAHDEINERTHKISLMYPWVEEKGYPVLTVKRKYSTSTVELLVDNLNFGREIRPIPVTYTTRTNLNFNRIHIYKWITPPYKKMECTVHVTIPDAHPIPSNQEKVVCIENEHFTLNYTEDSWIIFNIQQTGYYRVKYDDENWARISAYLNNDTFWKIHVLNRAQLIDDAFQFMILDQLKADIFWQLAKYLGRETDYIAWYPMFKAIEYMSNGFVFFKEQHIIWTNLAIMLNKLLDKIKAEEQLTDDDFTKALRQEAAQWACRLKLDDCEPVTNLFLLKHLKINTKLSPWWKKWIYCNGLHKADNITWQQTLNKIRGNNSDKILYLLTCPNHLDKINNYTSTTYTNDDIKSHITPSTRVQLELRNFVYTIEKNYLKSFKDNTTFINILDNFALIKSRQLKLSTTILILINNINNIAQLKRINKMNVFKGLEADLHEIPNKLAIRKSQLENHYRLFARIQPRH